MFLQAPVKKGMALFDFDEEDEDEEVLAGSGWSSNSRGECEDLFRSDDEGVSPPKSLRRVGLGVSQKVNKFL